VSNARCGRLQGGGGKPHADKAWSRKTGNFEDVFSGRPLGKPNTDMGTYVHTY